MNESGKEQLKRCAARCRRAASQFENLATLTEIECGNLALEILGLEVELAALRLLFAQNCMGSGTP